MHAELNTVVTDLRRLSCSGVLRHNNLPAPAKLSWGNNWVTATHLHALGLDLGERSDVAIRHDRDVVNVTRSNLQ